MNIEQIGIESKENKHYRSGQPDSTKWYRKAFQVPVHSIPPSVLIQRTVESQSLFHLTIICYSMCSSRLQVLFPTRTQNKAAPKSMAASNLMTPSKTSTKTCFNAQYPLNLDRYRTFNCFKLQAIFFILLHSKFQHLSALRSSMLHQAEKEIILKFIRHCCSVGLLRARVRL